VRIGRVVGTQASRPQALLVSLKVRSMLKRTPGLHKFMSIVHEMSMKLEIEVTTILDDLSICLIFFTRFGTLQV